MEFRRATVLDPERGVAEGLRDPQPIRNPARRSSRCTRCIGKNDKPHRREACRRARRAQSRVVLVHV
jgi:hypothetical protein